MRTTVLFVLMLVLAGCSSEAQDSSRTAKVDLDKLKQSSQFNQHVFSNKQLGVSFKLPDCFELVPEAQTQKYLVGRAQVLLNAICRQPDGNRSAVAYIVEQIPDGVTTEKYARVNLDNSVPKPNIALGRDLHEEIFAGRNFQSYDVDITGAEVRLKQRYFITTDANVGLTLILMGSSDSLMSTLIDSVQTSYNVSH